MSVRFGKYLKSLAFLMAPPSERNTIFRRYVMAEHDRWILWLPVLLGMGVGGYFALPFEPVWYAGPSVAILLALAGWMLRRNIMFSVPIMVILAVVTGFSAGSIRTALVSHTILDREVGPTRVSGQVMEVHAREAGARLIIAMPDIAGLPALKRPQKIRININTGNGPPIHPGDRVRMTAVLRPPQQPASPGAFDFQRHIYFQGIGATGFSYGAAEVTKRARNTAFATKLQAVRDYVGRQIRSRLDGTTGAVAAALVTGDRGAIPEASVNAMRDAGLAHLLAISGLHIGLVAGLVFFAARAIFACIPVLALRYPIKAWAASLGIIAALGYTLLAGSTVPTIRAFTMMSLVFIAIMIGRKGISLRLVAWAASLVLVFRPESLVGASFQLSFAAVTGLVAAYEYMNHRYRSLWYSAHPLKRMFLYMAGIGFSTIIASLATAPFAAYHFHQLASYGLLSNFIAVPVTASWIMPWALVALGLMPVGLEELGLVPMGWGVGLVLAVAEVMAPLPGNVRYFPAMPAATLPLFALGGLWLCIWWQRWRTAGLVPIIVGLIVMATADEPGIIAAANGQVFGVRQGDAMVMIGPRRRGNRFTRKIWLERAGLGGNMASHAASHAANDPDSQESAVNCDSLGCVLGNDLSGISLVWQEAALLDDCWRSRIIISTVPVTMACPQPEIIIDWFDLWRNGAHAIYVNDGHDRVENTHKHRGIRPWTGRRP